MKSAHERLDALAGAEHARLQRDARALVDHAGATGARMHRAHPWVSTVIAAVGGAALAASLGGRRGKRTRRGAGVISSSLTGLLRSVALQFVTAGISAAQSDSPKANGHDAP